MTRSGIAKPVREFDLYGAILKYATTKEEVDSLKKVVDQYNTDIKQEFKNRNITEYIANNIKATVSYTPKEDFNELQAITILKKELAKKPDLLSSIVKTREFIDQDAFEKAVYNKQVNAEILAPAITPKEPVATLRLGKVKN